MIRIFPQRVALRVWTRAVPEPLSSMRVNARIPAVMRADDLLPKRWVVELAAHDAKQVERTARRGDEAGEVR